MLRVLASCTLIACLAGPAVAGEKAPTFGAEVAHRSCALVHLGEIAYRLGRTLTFDPKTETFPADKEATSMLSKKYRAPWGV